MNPNIRGWTIDEQAGDPASGPIWAIRDGRGRWVAGLPRADYSRDDALRRAMAYRRPEKKPKPPMLDLDKLILWLLVLAIIAGMSAALILPVRFGG